MPNDQQIDQRIEKSPQPDNKIGQRIENAEAHRLPEHLDPGKREAVLQELQNSSISLAEKSVSDAAASVYDHGQNQVQEIECILEEGLRELYLNMPHEIQPSFKKKGEETAEKIIGLIRENTKNIIWKIIKLISEWLRMIPNVKEYFVEQEAKIKADKILEELNVNKYR